MTRVRQENSAVLAWPYAEPLGLQQLCFSSRLVSSSQSGFLGDVVQTWCT